MNTLTKYLSIVLLPLIFWWHRDLTAYVLFILTYFLNVLTVIYYTLKDRRTKGLYISVVASGILNPITVRAGVNGIEHSHHLILLLYAIPLYSLSLCAIIFLTHWTNPAASEEE